MLLNHEQLKVIVKQGVITSVADELVNATSIDVTLGAELILESKPLIPNFVVELDRREPMLSERITIPPDGYVLRPGEFLLACTEQTFNLPMHLSAEYKLKSSMARIGLEHLNAGWCDPGWHGSVLTLELKNMTQYHNILLRRGDRIGQVVFWEHEPVGFEASYAARGRYNGDRSVSGAKISVAHRREDVAELTHLQETGQVLD